MTHRGRPSLRRRTPRRPPRGMTMLEVIVSTVILAAAVGLTVETITSLAGLRRAAEQRQYAVQEAHNTLERITAQPPQSVTAQNAAGWQLSPEARRALRDGELSVVVASTAGPLEPRRVSVEVRWRGRTGEYESPVRLTTWIYPQARGEE